MTEPSRSSRAVRALAGQIPLLVVMVAYTVGGLLLLFSRVIEVDMSLNTRISVGIAAAFAVVVAILLIANAATSWTLPPTTK